MWHTRDVEPNKYMHRDRCIYNLYNVAGKRGETNRNETSIGRRAGPYS